MLAAPVHKDLVLIGGGHSHLTVLRRFGMHPISGVRLTLISPSSAAPYSGMLPGLVAGYYSFDEAHIDLAPLSRFAGARLIRAAAVGIDPAARAVALDGRPPIHYDVLSLNTGSTPGIPAAVSADSRVTPVKPVDGFLRAWRGILEAPSTAVPRRLAVVGGGAGGVELALAMAARLDRHEHRAELTVLTADDSIVPTHNRGVRRRLGAALERAGVRVMTGAKVVASDNGTLALESGERATFDDIVWVTQASAPAWLGGSGLALDANGFLRVDERLRSVSDERIFGAGDVVSLDRQPRPKSGVFAVRQGRPLADNLRAALLGRRPQAYRPQRHFLSLIGTGDGGAVGSRGAWSCSGAAVWRLKEWIDRRFMERYRELPAMDADADHDRRPVPAAIAGTDAPDPTAAQMRCGGCGAKTAATVLDAALTGLTSIKRDDIVGGLDAPDDAALLRVPAGRLVAISVDAFRPMLDDPWLFGRITANHCLNDLFAMGAEPQAALAIVTLPAWPETKLVDELRQMLSGAVHELEACGAALVGGHTAEGAEIGLGFSVTGLLDGAALARRGMKPGDALVLTKPVGTGTVLAAAMQGRARGRWLDAAIATMLVSGAAAGRILRKAGAHACTDVTGFGLLGHLLEMARPAGARIALAIDAVPMIDGALDCLNAGIRSTMAPKNAAFGRGGDVSRELTAHAHSDMLFDPQTAGGLLAALPADRAVACIEQLRSTGYRDAAVIGHVLASNGADGPEILAAT